MSIDPNKIKAIFLNAVEQCEPGKWDAFLNAACEGDNSLRRRVEVLLEAHLGKDSMFDGQVIEAPPTLDQFPRELPGALIGPYKLLEQIGEGGMGLVYMAEQQRPMRRLVALKLIKPGMDSKQVIARFEAEKQALAMMDHENIAKVFEAGTTDTGRFYFAMELVRGMPINEFCDQQRLSVRERLELFIQVCQAVQHAHQKGIIHRDLKPTNVLVTNADTVPLPKVIDFGIAKALGPALTDHTLHTGFAQLVGTPMYMSPEQAQMNHFGVDTRSDVYSLGVLLYELLTGTTPFDKETLSKAGLDEMRRMIREVDPPSPSARISTLNAQALSTISQQRNIDPRRVSASLRGELDWIVMKALEKDRSRRYESASALAADIQRYLSDEPVLACPPTTMYRFQKFARKHKPALATAAAIAICLFLGTTVSAWQAVRATTAEAQANANEAQAKEAAAAETQQRQRAETNEQKANTQRDEAQRQRDEVRALADQLRRTLYASNMNLAKSAWDTGNAERVLELLEQHRPKPGEAELRGFEWHYLYRLCHTDLLTLKLQGSGAFAFAFSADGKRLASGNDRWDEQGKPVPADVKVWDAQTGRELHTLKGHTRLIQGVAFSSDGKRLASGSQDQTVKVWDAETGQELLTLKGHAGGVIGVAFSLDGKRLASGSQDKTVKVWDTQTGQELLTFKGHARAVPGIVFSPDGQRLASASIDQTVKVWNAQTGQELLTLKGHVGSLTQRVAFSPDGKRLASASGYQTVTVWDAQTGQKLVTLKGAVSDGLAFNPDGSRLAGSTDQAVKVWDAHSGEELLTLKGHTAHVRRVTFSSDGKRLASVSVDGIVKVWDARTDSENRTLKGWNVAFSPDGKRLASAGASLRVCDVQTGQELLTLKGHSRGVSEVVFSPDGKRLASASRDQTVKVWDAQTGQELLTLKGHTNNVLGVAFSPDGQRLASCGWIPGPPRTVGEVKVWDAQTGQELLTFKGHTGLVWSVAFSPDGKRLASASADGTKVWDAQTGQEILTLKGHTDAVYSVAFSPDGKRLAGASGDKTVKVWDAQTGQELLTLKGHSGRVSSVEYSPGGKRLVSATQDGTVKVWDAQTGQELLTLKGYDPAFSPDGQRLAAGTENGTVHIWDATPLSEKP